jgi:hypothetical protein
MILGIQPLLPNQRLDHYDMIFAALGYESRAPFVSQELGLNGREKLALGFLDHQELYFRDNEAWFRNAGFEVLIVGDADARRRLQDIETGRKEGDEHPPLSCCIDISCFNRVRLAALVHFLAKAGATRVVRAHFFYCIAEYSDPVTQLTRNSFAGPVIPEFAGWSPNPELPPVAIVGLGYEEGKALGAVEYLQADEAWLFDPSSPIGAYRAALEKANDLLLDACHASRRIGYQVGDPASLFARLEGLSSAIAKVGRPHILPFGPKIFSLVSFLVACTHRNVAVWRVSAGENEPATDKRPSSHIVGLEVWFAPTRDSLADVVPGESQHAGAM